MVGRRIRFEWHVLGPCFVELWRDGNVLGRSWGRIGTPGRERVASFADEAEVEAALRRQVQRLEAKRYVAGRHHPKLEGAILADPENHGPYLVYADWLMEQGDPRGFFISAMVAGAAQEANRILDEHPEQLWPDWCRAHFEPEWRMGYLWNFRFRPMDRAGFDMELRLRRHASALVLRLPMTPGTTVA